MSETIALIIGFIAAFLSSASMAPQAIKIWKTKQVGDLSLISFLSMAIGVACWLIYGIMRADIVIISANSAGLLVFGYIVLMKIIYSNKKK